MLHFQNSYFPNEKISLLISFIFIQFSFTACNQSINEALPKDNPKVESDLKFLLAEKEYFKLREYFEAHKREMSQDGKLYFGAFITNAFNQNDISFIYADSLLNIYKNALSDSDRVALLHLQRDNYIKAFQYRNAEKMDEKKLPCYRIWKDSIKIAEIENSLIIDKGLSDIPVQKVSLPATDTIKWKKDKIGLIEIPVQQKASTHYFVFDTRASVSVITESFAKRLGLKILNVFYEEHSGITGNKFKSGLGIADSLRIGAIIIEHAVFQVVPDSIIDFPQISFSINGIIGFPIIRALKHISIFQSGELIISSQSNKPSLNNLALDESTTVVSFKTDEDTLSFHFDLGATNSILYHRYLEKYKSKILQSGHLKSTRLGGAGGIENRDVYVLPHFNLYAGDKKVSIDSVEVLTKAIYPGQKYYGNIGQDLVTQFKKMTIDFESMSLDFH